MPAAANQPGGRRLGRYPELHIVASTMVGELSSPEPAIEARGRALVTDRAKTVAALCLASHAPAWWPRRPCGPGLGDHLPTTLGLIEPDLVTDGLIEGIDPVS